MPSRPEYKKVGAGWLTKAGNGYNCKIEEDIVAGDKLLIQKNKYKDPDNPAHEKKPDIELTIILEDGQQQQQQAPKTKPTQGGFF